MRARVVAAAWMSFFGVAAGIVGTLNGPIAVWGPLAGAGLVCAAAVVVLTVLEQRHETAAEHAPTRVGMAAHFEPQSRGAELGEAGWYFTGRVRAIRELSAWLIAGDDPRTRVLTGRPGAGKSALIGRLVMLSDRRRRQEILTHEPDLAAELRLEMGVIDVAVNAAGKTADQVAGEIATALRLGERLPALVVQALDRADAMRRVVVDSVDEATDPHELIAALLLPLGRSARVQLVLGTRRPYVRALGGDETNVVLDLDPEARDYFEQRDVVDYVAKRLQAGGRYRNTGMAREIAEAIAARASGNFLIAQLVARYHSEKPPDTTAPGWQNQLPDSVSEAMDQDLRRLGARQRLVRELLLALAYVEGSGVPRHGGVWEAMANSLAGAAERRLTEVFDDRRALAYLAEQVEDGRRVYRVYHRALSEHLKAADGPDDAQARITSALVGLVPDAPGGDGRDWSRADPYIRNHVAAHAAAARSLGRLLEDPDFLLAADPTGLLRALRGAGGGAAVVRRAYREFAQLLYYPQFADVLPEAERGERAAYLEMAARWGGATALAERIARRHPDRPWAVPWARWRVGAEHFIVGRHDDGISSLVTAVGLAELDGRPVAVSASAGQTLQAWDIAAGGQLGEPIACRMGGIWALALGELDGGGVIVAGGGDGTVRVWNLADGSARGQPLVGHVGRVRAVAVARLDDGSVIVSAGDDGTVRVWNLADGSARGQPLVGHAGRVRAVAVGKLDDGGAVAVSGGDDGTLRVWDLAAGSARGDPVAGHDGAVSAVAVGELDGRAVIVSGGVDRTLQVWDLADGTARGDPLAAHGSMVLKVAVGEVDRSAVAVSAGFDMTLRLWDLTTRRPLSEPLAGVGWTADAVSVGIFDGGPLAVSAGDVNVRVWDLAAAARTAHEPHSGLDSAVNAVAMGEFDGRAVAVSGGDDGRLRVWDLADGAPRGNALGHLGAVRAIAIGRLDQDPVIACTGSRTQRGRMVWPPSFLSVCVWDVAADPPAAKLLSEHYGDASAVAVSGHDGRPLIVAGRRVIVSAGVDEIRVWELAAGAPSGEPVARHPDHVTALAMGELDGRAVIVSGGDDYALRVWDLASGAPRCDPLTGHAAVVNAVAVSELDGALAVSGDNDGTVRAWDLAAGAPRGEAIAPHDGAVHAVAVIHDGGRPLIVSGGEDETVRVSDLAGSQLFRITVDSPVHAIAARGRTFVLGADAGIITITLTLPARGSLT